MKKYIVLIALAAFALACAACTGGFVDPGAGGGGGSGGISGGKPSKLSDSASLSEVKKKLTEIKDYCKKHSGNEAVEMSISSIEYGFEYMTESDWQSQDSYARSTIISQINAIIAALT